MITFCIKHLKFPLLWHPGHSLRHVLDWSFNIFKDFMPSAKYQTYPLVPCYCDSGNHLMTNFVCMSYICLLSFISLVWKYIFSWISVFSYSLNVRTLKFSLLELRCFSLLTLSTLSVLCVTMKHLWKGKSNWDVHFKLFMNHIFRFLTKVTLDYNLLNLLPLLWQTFLVFDNRKHCHDCQCCHDCKFFLCKKS